MHLSDSVEMCDAMMKVYKEKDHIDKVMYIDKSKVVLVTKKQSLMSAATEGSFVTDFDDLQTGALLPGWVKGSTPSFGVFLRFPGKLRSLVPRRYLMDRLSPELEQSNIFKSGQTVVAKVMDVDREKKQSVCSLRLRDCYHYNTNIGIDITEN